MVHDFRSSNTIVNAFIAELRDEEVQKDRLRFRTNLQRFGEVAAYEISKTLKYEERQVDTPLGTAKVSVPQDPIVLATILRAGLPLHEGLMRIYDRAPSAFVSAYRRHHKSGDFEIELEYISCPALEGTTLVVSDAMMATGSSMVLATQKLLEYGEPKAIHFVSSIASTEGLAYVQRNFPESYFWLGAIDEELTARSYIVPGLGDAGDLCFGEKLQE